MTKAQQKWEKEELLKLYRKNRQTKRCLIVKALKDEANELTKSLRLEIHNLEAEVVEILEKKGLVSFDDGQYTCNPNKHESLVEFDIETDSSLQAIVNGTFEGSVTE